MQPVLATAEAHRLARLFKTLGEPTRLRLVAELSRGARCVHELASALGLPQPAVSQQLRLLRERGLVRAERRGRHMFYRLDDDHVADLYQRALSHSRHRAGAGTIALGSAS